MMRRVLIGALLLLLLPTSPAVAEAPISDEMMRVARAAWPASPCRHRENVSVERGLPFLGFAVDDGAGLCVAVVAPRGPVSTCSALTHELGHLAGFGHTGKPGAKSPPDEARRALMRAEGAMWPPCYRFRRR